MSICISVPCDRSSIRFNADARAVSAVGQARIAEFAGYAGVHGRMLSHIARLQSRRCIVLSASAITGGITSRTAMRSKSIACSSLSDLMVRNADYLVDAIGFKLRSAESLSSSLHTVAPHTRVSAGGLGYTDDAQPRRKTMAELGRDAPGSGLALDDEFADLAGDSSAVEGEVVELDVSWTSTLPRVLQALLQRTGPETGPVIIPLLDDVLQSVLDALGDSSAATPTPIASASTPSAALPAGKPSSQLVTADTRRDLVLVRQQLERSHREATITAYLEVLHCVVIAIRSMHEAQRKQPERKGESKAAVPAGELKAADKPAGPRLLGAAEVRARLKKRIADFQDRYGAEDFEQDLLDGKTRVSRSLVRLSHTVTAQPGEAAAKWFAERQKEDDERKKRADAGDEEDEHPMQQKEVRGP